MILFQSITSTDWSTVLEVHLVHSSY